MTWKKSLSQLGATTDAFGSVIGQGDWVIVTIATRLYHDQIKEIVRSGEHNIDFIHLVNTEQVVNRFQCMKFSPEEMTMRKLESVV